MATTGRSEAMQALKEKRIAAIQKVCDRDFPDIHSLDLDRQAAAMRRCETDPTVWAIDDEIRALRLKEAAGDAD